MISVLPLATIPAADEALRAPVRAFLATAMKDVAPEVRARTWLGFDAAFSRQLADRGWLGMTLPTQYGGQARGHFARFVVVEELLAAGAPVSAHWIADRQSGPLIAKYGTETQKQFYLPKICKAEAFFCIGMSEPNAGSDLASVGSRAEPTAAGWKLNGRKIWTTNAPHSHYVIVLVRTSGSPADRQKGLSQFIVDLAAPGVSVRPIRDLAGDAHFSEIFFDDVELDEHALIGAEGAGWEQVTAELAFERSGPERLYSSIVLLDEWLNYLRKAAPRDSANVRLMGRFISHLAVLREMSISVTSKLANGDSPVVEAALVKDLGTEFEQSVPSLIADALGALPDAGADAPLLATLAYLTQVAPTFSLRGGTREILRGMIARGLGLR
ncbi:acyl-CoA dehydrogenase family protein [Janthinobacterium sp. PC23-8]|uniref:acyl-CoA dehydrogenase family protein n=1 Tax=Janthinobacterium sp. PC23-8 TaxID=2012679 RepID=UPI000B97C469|nr:acyl-CoA dehydrogenase family protein [Janthinobacterium sp. PC23-8]OYO26333.1 acyl-CoA dehydrogenase [Janthinobacterium sp. PC23-8]